MRVFQLLASIAGFVSVYYWWVASRIGPVDVPAQTLQQGRPGDMLFDYGGTNMIFMNYARQSRMNARAAAWTGVSVFFQVIPVVLPTIWS
jgi:hypothetical protein